MKLGPNSSKAAASRWPRRGCTGPRRGANRCANRTNGAAAGSDASGNSASCRARIRQIRISRPKLRILRQGPNRGRSESKTPGRMERSDPPRQVAKPDSFEPGSVDHLRELALPRKAPDTFDEINVGVALAGHDLAKQRHKLEAVNIVERLQERIDFRSEFEAEEAPAGLQHAARLGKRHIDTGDVPQPEPNRVEIDAAVGHGKPFGIGAHPLDSVENALIEGTRAANREHRRARIANNGSTLHHRPVLQEVGQGAQCDVAGTAGDIEKTLAGTRLQPCYHLRLPPAVDPAAHQIVHQIIARCDALEEGPHQRRLLAFWHLAEAEI